MSFLTWFTGRHRRHPAPSRAARPGRHLVASSSSERVTFLLIVGDAFARPLLDELDRHAYDLSSLTVRAVGRRAARRRR